jgi:hypothetical protein
VSDDQGVHSSVGATDAIASAIAQYDRSARSGVDGALAAVRAIERRTMAERDARHRDLEEKVRIRHQAERALAACTEGCDGLRRALAHAISEERDARASLDLGNRALSMVTEGRAALTARSRTFTNALERAAPGAQAAAAVGEGMRAYLTTDITSTGRADTGPASPGGSAAKMPSATITSVSLADVMDDREVAPSFQKVSREQVAWGLEALHRVVAPAVARGKGAEYLAQRDEAEGLSGERSYSGVHRWYYSPDHVIKLSRGPDGRLEIENGYHRIHVARELGFDELPGRVR